MLTGVDKDPLIAALRAREDTTQNNFWTFPRPTQRQGAHALLHYPAMMVPSLQGLIMSCAQATSGPNLRTLDPFVGSGTVLVESMEHGLNFTGIDVNPLAGLACLAKAGPYYIDAFHEKSMALLSAISTDTRALSPRSFSGRDKWFSIDVARYLEKACYHIRLENAKWARRLFWLALCRVVRATCNSRKTTYKLHIEAVDNNKTAQDAHVELIKTLESFYSNLAHQHQNLTGKALMQHGRYTGEINVTVGDSNEVLFSSVESSKQYGLVMTSPPYGDNTTTIPYGQFSFLPLQWIDIEDVDPSIDTKLTSNTHATDTASLGGMLKGASEKMEYLSDQYPVAARMLRRLRHNENGARRFASFFFDLDRTVGKVARATKRNGIHAWTIANRRICGIEAPMVPLMQAMLAARGINAIGSISRGIHFKKMAHRNSLTSTMTTETILLARKA